MILLLDWRLLYAVFDGVTGCRLEVEGWRLGKKWFNKASDAGRQAHITAIIHSIADQCIRGCRPTVDRGGLDGDF